MGGRFRHFGLSGSQKLGSKGQLETCMESFVARRQIQQLVDYMPGFCQALTSERWDSVIYVSFGSSDSIETLCRRQTFLHSELDCQSLLEL